MIIGSSNNRLERFGFSHERGSAHTARTMMLNELNLLLEYVSGSSPAREDYLRAIEQYNCLGKRSHKTRTLTKGHLIDLYALDPETTLFRTLRHFWQRDPEGRPLIACLCAYARDPLLRISAPYVLKHADGQIFSRQALEEHLEMNFPGRFSKATLTSTAQNIASTWRQAGHLTGRVKKVRSRPIASAGSTSYALLLGFLTGERGENLLKTDYTKLLDCSFEKVLELAETASLKGWIVFKRISDVIEVVFPSVLTEQETEWIREQN